jgi:hypothetical protein
VPSVSTLNIIFLSRSRVLFVGTREAAEFEASRRNERAQKHYRDTAVDAVIDLPKQDFAAMIAAVTEEMEARTYQEETLGLANIVCINALSLPA